jgi:hypothetical protein
MHDSGEEISNPDSNTDHMLAAVVRGMLDRALKFNRGAVVVID